MGTSSFTAEGWEKSFYPPGMPARDYLSYYATQFDTLEIDATFYAIPSVSTVKGWDAKTPPTSGSPSKRRSRSLTNGFRSMPDRFSPNSSKPQNRSAKNWL